MRVGIVNHQARGQTANGFATRAAKRTARISSIHHPNAGAKPRVATQSERRSVRHEYQVNTTRTRGQDRTWRYSQGSKALGTSKEYRPPGHGGEVAQCGLRGEAYDSGMKYKPPEPGGEAVDLWRRPRQRRAARVAGLPCHLRGALSFGQWTGEARAHAANGDAA